MKTFQSIQEERGEKAFKQAIAMGLKYSGFGYWKDPQTGETKFKTENDTLVPVEPDIESELYKGAKPGEGQGTPDFQGGPGGEGQGMRNAAGMLQMPGGGMTQQGAGILGAPMPGAEKAPKENGWESGPDGDTCVGPDAEEPGKVPEDSYIGRTNFLKWGAGPEGDNMTTVSYEKVMEAAESIIPAPGQPMKLAQKQAEDNKRLAGYVQNPSYDIDKNRGKGIDVEESSYAQGIHQGKTPYNAKPVIIKDGYITENEVKAMHDLRDVEGVPNVVNARVTAPLPPDRDATGGSSTPGSIAMEKAGDDPLYDSWDNIKDKNAATKKIFQILREVHQRGWAHGDLHSDNIRWDKAEQTPHVIDFGRGVNDKFAAIEEAIGGIRGTDDQQSLHTPVGKLRSRLIENLENIRDFVTDQVDSDEFDLDTIEDLLSGAHIHETDGDILHPTSTWKKNKETFGSILDDEKLDTILSMIYEGLDDIEEEKPTEEDRKLKSKINKVRAYKNRSPLGTMTVKKLLNPDD